MIRKECNYHIEVWYSFFLKYVPLANLFELHVTLRANGIFCTVTLKLSSFFVEELRWPIMIFNPAVLLGSIKLKMKIIQ